jgi:hypothetical protein
MGSLDDLRALGYTVAAAYGHLQPELDALERARAAATTDRVGEDAAPVIAEAQRLAADQMRGSGRYTDVEIRDVLARLQEQTVRQLQERRDAHVAHHEAAVDVARGMPDVWHVNGHGVQLYVAVHPDTGAGWSDADQELLDALADKKSHRERVAQLREKP